MRQGYDEKIRVTGLKNKQLPANGPSELTAQIIIFKRGV